MLSLQKSPSANATLRFNVLTFLCFSAALLANCGPAIYLSEVSIDATRHVVQAEAADARRLAPYEYWSATEYLFMAREKAAYADFELSVEYGRKAKQMAMEAQRVASERARSVEYQQINRDASQVEAPTDVSNSGE